MTSSSARTAPAALTLILSACILILASWAVANPLPVCGFDDPGMPAVLGMAGDGEPPILATIEPGGDGYALRLQNNSAVPGARAYIAAVRGLYSLYDCSVAMQYDIVSVGEPGVQLRARYCNSLPGDFDQDLGEIATLPLDPANNWEYLGWTIDTPEPGMWGLVVEVMFLDSQPTVVWIDNLEVGSMAAELITPCYSVVANEAASLSSVKSLFR